ncbi:MAG: hypothetical protein MZV70_61360 [Desulfobacterales bacterium]|nr:hypothetical protein [Desulfobacterales bacterium]
MYYRLNVVSFDHAVLETAQGGHPLAGRALPAPLRPGDPPADRQDQPGCHR